MFANHVPEQNVTKMDLLGGYLGGGLGNNLTNFEMILGSQPVYILGKSEQGVVHPFIQTHKSDHLHRLLFLVHGGSGEENATTGSGRIVDHIR